MLSLIGWFEKLAGEPGDAAKPVEAAGFCWPCAIMGVVTFAGLTVLVYWLLSLFLV